MYQRANLIHREQHIFVFGYVSDEKIHGIFAVHHYTDTELNFLERYMLIHHPDDIPQGKIFLIRQHSDNVGQHFKNTRAINYFKTLIIKHGGPIETTFVYSLGVPGHVKGPYDRIGGIFKNRIHCLIKSSKT